MHYFCRMGKNKLQKFSEMAEFPHVFEYPYAVLQEKECALKGNWHRDIFKNNYPIVLELGCGRGEYTVGLGRLFPSKNFVGVDIKGARMWAGAKESINAGMCNVAFLRTDIEMIDLFFANGEVNEIYLPRSHQHARTEISLMLQIQYGAENNYIPFLSDRRH